MSKKQLRIKTKHPGVYLNQATGNTQATILKRYSHMFEGDEEMILEALERIK